MTSSREWFPTLSDKPAQRIVNKLVRDSSHDPHEFVYAAEKWLEVRMAGRVGDSESADRAAFLISVILDQVAWGAQLSFPGSQIRLVVPQVDRANANAKEINRSRLVDLRRKDESFYPLVSASDALNLLKTGTLSLERANSANPEALSAFNSGITTWSMPYRGREGRSAKFTLFIESGNKRVPAGIIEIGDDAPLNPVRDEALGLKPPRDRDLRLRLAQRLGMFRAAIIPQGLSVEPTLPLEDLIDDLDELRQRGQGRSGSGEDIVIRKRYAYLYRLTVGEAALRGLAPEIFEHQGIRALRDILLTRIHGEITVCGALPPFGRLLGGKLMAGFMAHPLLRMSLDTAPGEILRQTFDAERIFEVLPRGGPVYLTTKGLYAAHSAQYNRVRFPTVSGSFEALKKIGVTAGQTTSHLSDRTMALASAIDGEEGRLGVSRLYGSGGGKRHRLLQRAATDSGLPAGMIFAEVRRPIYGVRLASNVSEAVLFGESPDWLFGKADPDGSDLYAANALENWRNSFLRIAADRLRDSGLGETAS